MTDVILPIEDVKALLLVMDDLEMLAILTGSMKHDITEEESYDIFVGRFLLLCEEVDQLVLSARNVKATIHSSIVT